MSNYLEIAQRALDQRQHEFGDVLADDPRFASWSDEARRHYADLVGDGTANDEEKVRAARREALAIDAGLDPQAGAGLVGDVLDVFGDDGVELIAVTPRDEPTPFEREYFAGKSVYLRYDLEVVWRNSYRRALRWGLKPWQAERVAWRRVKKRSRAT